MIDPILFKRICGILGCIVGFLLGIYLFIFPVFADDTSLVDDAPVFTCAYSNYIIYKDFTATHLSISSTEFCRVSSSSGVYSVIANYNIASDGDYTYFRSTDFGTYSSLDECIDSLQNGNLSHYSYNCYISDYGAGNSMYTAMYEIASRRITSNILYNSDEITFEELSFPLTPYLPAAAPSMMGGLTAEILANQENPLREVLSLIPLTIPAVACFLGLRKALIALSGILRKA